MSKKRILEDFINKFKSLPQQRSTQWLNDRKYHIGGSEMGTIVGCNPYKSLRGLIEGHLGITTFTGNINTYWGTILEDLVTLILEKKWNCKIYETGSLPGAIDEQKYSPDGLVYLSFLDMIILIEIKSAARRIANGKIPRMYKPQIYTGLDTVQIADMGLFVDALFRRCAIEDLKFTPKYDTLIHPDKVLNLPLVLCMLCIYDEKHTQKYTMLKSRYGKKNDDWIDAGSCSAPDLELLLKETAEKKLKFFVPKFVERKDNEAESIRAMFDEFNTFIFENKYVPIAIMPLKLFKLELVPVERNSWRNTSDNDEKSFVESYRDTIKKVIYQIKHLDGMNRSEQLKELDELYPPPNNVTTEMYNDLVNSLCM